MNQSQRDFLIRHIQKAHQNHIDSLKKRKPKRPSLNNYLVAAILEGSFELNPEARLKAFIRQLVLNLGPSGSLVKGRDRYDDDDNIWEHQVTIDAEEVFVLPVEYQTARDVYKCERAAWDAEVAQAEGIKEALILKVQIGSNEVLKRLVDQIDNMADLQLVNSRLQLLLTE